MSVYIVLGMYNFVHLLHSERNYGKLGGNMVFAGARFPSLLMKLFE